MDPTLIFRDYEIMTVACLVGALGFMGFGFYLPAYALIGGYVCGLFVYELEGYAQFARNELPQVYREDFYPAEVRQDKAA